MKKSIVFILVILLNFAAVVYSQNNSGYHEKDGNLYYDSQFVTNIAYQINADIIRLRHLKYYGELIEEYFKVKGHYPFQFTNKVQTYVYIANKSQAKFAMENSRENPNKHEVISFKDFIKEIETTLGREIDEYYDPQSFPDAKPNYYVYAVIDGNYYFAVHVHQKFLFSKFIYPYFYKVEVSNITNRSSNLILTPKELFNSESFIEEINKPVKNEGHFKALEERFKNETKKKKK